MPILIGNWFDWTAIVSDWQTAVALAIVFLAAVAMVPRVWKLFSSQSNNGGCGNCLGCKNGSGATPPMVNIQLKQK
ncbi:MAG: FeoB-associated Cys-rich membrane protein [Planctomycetota bacterium]|nr:FeoB-associated Cys-rich membrane protein [Planctomycetota bacterium]